MMDRNDDWKDRPDDSKVCPIEVKITGTFKIAHVTKRVRLAHGKAGWDMRHYEILAACI